jgi:hypothetical protein
MDAMPGDEGMISRTDFDIMVYQGWEYAIYWNGEGSPREYIANMRVLLKDKEIEFPDTFVFASESYLSEYDFLMKEFGISNVIHHGEDKRKIIEQTVDEIWHPGAVGWNTIGVSNSLLSETVNRGGITMFEINFSGNTEFIFDHSLLARVEAFGRMLDVIEGLVAKDKLVLTDLESAKRRRTEYLTVREEVLEDIAARKVEILAEIKDLNNKINEIYKKYH